MDSFEILSVHGGGKLELVGTIPRGLTGYEGFELVASLVSPHLAAHVRVYDVQPQSWAEFFAELAQHWRGWKGAKERESLEHHLRIVATADSLGHISLRVHLRDMLSDANWRAEDVITVEAGQLESIAARAKRYFAPDANAA
jgi:hypothetical protein